MGRHGDIADFGMRIAEYQKPNQRKENAEMGRHGMTRHFKFQIANFKLKRTEELAE